MVTIQQLENMFGEDYNQIKKMVVTKLNGTKEQVRIWHYHNQDLNFKHMAIVRAGCSRSSRYLTSEDIKDWLSIKPAKKFELTLDLYDKRVRKAIDMLEKSGLWSNIKNELLFFIKQNTANRQRMINDILESEYEKFYLECKEGGKYWWVKSYQIFVTLTKERCWTSIPLPTYCTEKAYQKEKIAKAIKNMENYRGRWKNKYDISVDLEMTSDGIYGGWLSCEYVGCVNGHYYLLFDATHAIFYEDD